MKLEKGQKIQLGGAGLEIEAIVLEANSEGFRFIEVATEGRDSLITGFYSFSDSSITLDDAVPVEFALAHFIDDSDSSPNSPKKLLWSTLYIIVGLVVVLTLVWKFNA